MNENRGFSIIEILVYVGILAIASTLIVASMVQLAQVYGKGRAERKLALGAENALERIVREIRLAKSVDVASPYALPGPRLKLNTYISHTNLTDTTRTIDLNAGRVLLDNSASQTLMPSDITVSDLVFTRLAGGTTDAVRVRLTASIGGGPFQITRTYYATAVLRGSYFDI